MDVPKKWIPRARFHGIFLGLGLNPLKTYNKHLKNFKIFLLAKSLDIIILLHVFL